MNRERPDLVGRSWQIRRRAALPQKRGRKKKLHGRIGHTRAALMGAMYIANGLFFIVLGFTASILLGSAIRLAGLEMSAAAQSLAFLLCLATIFALGTWRLLKGGSYFARELTDEQYTRLQAFNLIHYTDYLGEQDLQTVQENRQVRLYGNGSLESNYSLRGADRYEKFVWFHPSNGPSSKEPDFDSFWFSHMGETSPRAYKLIIPFSSLTRNDLLVRPYDGAILLRGDYSGMAVVETQFEWYNDRVYVLRSMRVKLLDFFGLFVNAYRQGEGVFEDRRKEER
jgi:hypothetical protein